MLILLFISLEVKHRMEPKRKLLIGQFELPGELPRLYVCLHPRNRRMVKRNMRMIIGRPGQPNQLWLNVDKSVMVITKISSVDGLSDTE